MIVACRAMTSVGAYKLSLRHPLPDGDFCSIRSYAYRLAGDYG